ncbi:MAG TPA: methylated-DNA--[protein]-cysteine S-methyltransferase [Actinomycetota bacterium]|jgi:O-6-methylguanine DNA methyltransferase|nr:methylated-DNA--[protein]-cysteine S-methyltransferase [Actinomycetota bacterium]
MSNEHTDHLDGGWRELAEGLRGLRAEPPATLRPAVLERVGLADALITVDGPAGPLLVAYNGRGISATAPGEDSDGFAERFQARFRRPLRPADRPPARLVAQVERLLSPGRRATPPSFDLRGTSEFERAVLAKALEIPRGQVRPYAWVAGELRQPAAVRAVGAALGRNPVPVLIPCHRVVGSDGRLTGYAWGVPYKRALLAAEGADPDELERLGRRGTRFFGSDTTRIYCYPTCAHARRVTDHHRMTFTGAAQAAAAGYRPCRVCRPPALSG